MMAVGWAGVRSFLKRAGSFLLSSFAYIAKGVCTCLGSVLLDGLRFAAGWVIGIVLGISVAITFFRELLGIALFVSKVLSRLVQILLAL